MNTSLNSVEAVVVLDSTGQRVMTKYYRPKDQKYEKRLWDKTRRSNSEIILFENNVVCYRNVVDLWFYVICGKDENEIMMTMVLNCFIESLEQLLKSVEKHYIRQNFDVVALALDECLDDGIILETDAVMVASRVLKRPPEMDEKKIIDAISKAKELFK